MIRLRLLGPVDLQNEDGHPVHSVLAQPKRLALLAYLAAARPGAFHRRDALLALFWPESDETRARNALSQALHHLRRSLGDGALVGRGPDEVALNAAEVWCDVEEFERSVVSGRLDEAVELYRGPLLDGFSPGELPEWEHWVVARRERLRQAALEAFRTAAERRAAAGDRQGAASLWRRMLDEEPLSRVATLALMRALAEEGDRPAAVALGAAFQERLREELGTAPDAEVASLIDHLRAAPEPGADGPPPPAVAPSGEPSRRGRPGPEAHLRNLPIAPSRLIGRGAEVQAIHAMLLQEEVRLLTLTGTGGVGKTRLALEVARAFLRERPHEVAVVDLAPLGDPALIDRPIAGALGIREIGPRPLAEAVGEHLSHRPMLLLLDSLEHLLEAAPRLSSLLAAAPGLKLLVTSRAPLRLSLEHEYPVLPLPLPAPAVRSPGELLHEPAVELFVERARAVKPDFTLGEDNAAAVAEICARLDGLPLAIELAAARIRILSPQAMLPHLQHRLAILTGGARDLPPRQQTLRATIGWSHELLDEEERSLFRRLAVFRGGCSLTSVRTVVDAEDGAEPRVLDLLDSLVSQGLLLQADGAGGEPRFRMLETIQEYGVEQLTRSGELDAIQRRHAELFLALAEASEPGLTGPEQGATLQRLAGEQDNLLAALEWAERHRDAETALRLSSALGRFWYLHGDLTEGRRWTARTLALAPDPGVGARWRGRALLTATRLALGQGDFQAARAASEEALGLLEARQDLPGVALALASLGQAAWRHNELAEASAFYRRSLEVLRRLDEPRTSVSVLFNLGGVAVDQGELDEAWKRYTECLELARQVGDRALTAGVLMNLGMVAYRLEEMEVARSCLDEGLSIARAVGSKLHLAMGLNTLGVVERDLEDLDAARSLLEESRLLTQQLGDRHGLAHALHSLASVALRAGDLAEAETLLRQSLATFRELGIKAPVECFADLGEVALRLGRTERAIQLFAVASRLSETVGASWTPRDQARFQRCLDRARARVDAEEWRRRWEEQGSVDLEQAVRYALQGFPRGPAEPAARS